MWRCVTADDGAVVWTGDDKSGLRPVENTKARLLQHTATDEPQPERDTGRSFDGA